MPTNDFLTFAVAGGANVITQAAYLALAAQDDGFSSGIASSDQLNKVWRQSAFVTSALAQLMSTLLAADVLDDGNQAAFIVKLQAALAIAATTPPARIVTVSTALTILASDYAIGLNRTAGVAATAASLPASSVGQSFVLQDLVGNFNAFPVTVTPPGGTTIAGLATHVCNVNRQRVVYTYYGSNLFGVGS